MIKGSEVHTRVLESQPLSGAVIAEMSSLEARLVLVLMVAMESPGLVVFCMGPEFLCGNRKVGNGFFALIWDISPPSPFL